MFAFYITQKLFCFSGAVVLLIIDNYDSFTYNLYQYFCELGQDVLVKRNDAISLEEIETLAPDHLVISPGPCSPDEAGISLKAIAHFAGKVPILGVCLGHQSLAQVFGAKIVRAEKVMHGKTSLIYHQNTGIFEGLKSPFRVTRYHSLVVKKSSLPSCFEITAWTENEGQCTEIMAIRHRELAIEGVQFHPESILTEQGHALLGNFISRYAPS